MNIELDHKTHRKNFTIIIVGFFLGICLFAFLTSQLKNFDVDKLGMGQSTTSHLSYWQKHQISETHGSTDKVQASYKNIKPEYNKHRTAFWLGNSQLHSINYFETGNQLAFHYANERSRDKGLNRIYFGLSAPHLNIIESLAYFEILRSNNISPDYLIVSCTFRSFHKSRVRERIIEQLSDTLMTSDNAKLNLLKTELAFHYKEKAKQSGEVKENLQSKLEKEIVSNLEMIFPDFALRNNVRSAVTALPKNKIASLLIDKRSVPSDYSNIKLNFEALNAIIDLAEEDSTKVICYLPPHPQGISPFYYNKKDYQKFKEDLKALTSQYEHVYFSNLETYVPTKYWGQYRDGNIDVFHFQNKGHQLLGSAIDSIFTQIESPVKEEYDIQ